MIVYTSVTATFQTSNPRVCIHHSTVASRSEWRCVGWLSHNVITYYSTSCHTAVCEKTLLRRRTPCTFQPSRVFLAAPHTQRAPTVSLDTLAFFQCAPGQMWAQTATTHQNCLHFSICACHPCAGAMLIFSVSFQF